jgi:hypothetical protein
LGGPLVLCVQFVGFSQLEWLAIGERGHWHYL